MNNKVTYDVYNSTFNLDKMATQVLLYGNDIVKTTELLIVSLPMKPLKTEMDIRTNPKKS